MTNQTETQLSDCHGAPVVLCEGMEWDVPPESVRRGSTYYWGCSACHQGCGLLVTATTETENAMSQDCRALLDRLQAALPMPYQDPYHLDRSEPYNAHREGIRVGEEEMLRKVLEVILEERRRLDG